MQSTVTRLNHFIHWTGPRPTAVVREALHDPCHRKPFTRPRTALSHTASSSGDSDSSNLTSLLA